MCRKLGLISLIALINLTGWINLASSEEVIRNYDLKIKLKPKIIESRVYWQEREKTNWQEEIKYWKFGFLSSKEDLLPILIYGKNFYPQEEDYSGRYRWISQNGKLSVINLLNVKIEANLLFWADSFKKDRKIDIFVNGEDIKTVVVPSKDEFSQFIIEGITLKPGRNDVVFFSLEGTERLKPKEWQNGRETKDVSVKIKDDIEWQILSKSFPLGSLAEYKYAISNQGLAIMTYLKKKDVFLASRDLDIDLEEYPFIDFDLKATKTKINIFFGVDYSGDGKIDGYLTLDNLYSLQGINLFKLAKDNWREADYFNYGFRIKKVIMLLTPESEKTENSQIYVLGLKNLNLYNDKSLILAGKEFNKDQLKFEDINVKSEVTGQEGIIDVTSYFDAAPLGIEKYKKSELEEVRVFISLKNIDYKNYPYFSFKYNLDDSAIQDIELAILTSKEGKALNLKEGQYKKTENEIEVNLSQIKPEGRDIKGLIIRLKRKNDVDRSLPETQGWYRFELSDLRLSGQGKFPYPLKSKEENEQFLSLLSKVNPPLLKIDKDIFYLNDFGNFKSLQDLQRDVLVKKIKLIKGEHNYEKLDNFTFDVERVILEPEYKIPDTSQEPQITFKKLNPTKYLVKVEGAKEPFWLVFSESYNKQWGLYRIPNIGSQIPEFKEIIADYTKLGVKEARHLMKFTPQDIRFLFEKPLDAPHELVNGYANGWYIEPDKLRLGKDFILVIYFWPQSLFYLGIFISGTTLLLCIGYLIGSYFKRRLKKSAKG